MRSHALAILCGVLACLPAMPAAAGEGAVASPAPAPGFGPPVGDLVLEHLRGGESTTGVEVRISGWVEGNSADGIVSGHNSVDGGAFANAAGISTVIQNTGSNVLIQNGTSVNVQFAGAGP